LLSYRRIAISGARRRISNGTDTMRLLQVSPFWVTAMTTTIEYKSGRQEVQNDFRLVTVDANPTTTALRERDKSSCRGRGYSPLGIAAVNQNK
jgi:hypothetical protein